MKRILLMRHSIAESGSKDISDEKRTLTKSGIQLIKTQAINLQQINVFPDMVIASPAIRAITTAKILTEKLNYLNPIKVEPFLYQDFTTQEFLNYVHILSNSIQTVVIIGHNPTISTLLYRLTLENNFSFAPADIAIINLDFDNWRSIAIGKSKLEQYLLA